MVADKRKILVIGATGQQGGALARLLLQKKHEVYALVRNTESESPKAQNLRNLGAKLIKGDLNNLESLEQVTIGVDSVFLMGTFAEDGTEVLETPSEPPSLIICSICTIISFLARYTLVGTTP
jgi:uncharacterized protein YbjT (DUF2867 family)